MFGDPEAASGPDAFRHQAVALEIDEAVTDSVGIDEGDQTDWRAVELYDAGRMSVEFSADERDAETLIAVFDRYGTELRAIERMGGEVSALTVDVARGGLYFLKIQAVSGPPTAYDLKVSVGQTPRKKNTNVPAGRPGF